MATALVFSAAGMFGAWQVGVWKSLYRRFEPSLIVGTSAGAWNGWAVAGGATPDDLAQVWMDPATGAIMERGFHRYGFLRPRILLEKAREMFDRYQPKIPFGLTVVEVPRLRPVLVCDSAVTWRHLAATAAIPLGFPPVEINGRLYVDGGLVGALPLWAAEAMGATRVIAVNALTLLPFRILRRVLPPRRPSAALQVIRIEPSLKLGRLREALFWTRSNVERWMELGELDGNRAATSITM